MLSAKARLNELSAESVVTEILSCTPMPAMTVRTL